jgi:nitrite reductase (NADH) large subunit
MAAAKPLLVLVGNGMAGMRMIDELLALAPDRYEIRVLGSELHPNYNRILLSSVLAGEKTLDDIVLNPLAWYEERGIALTLGDPVTSLDPAARTVRTASGECVAYDKLVLATGSKPLVPPVAGLELKGVATFRNIADLEVMVAAAACGGRAVVVGGGLLGLEAAFGLKRRGMEVTVVHLARTVMERQLDEAAALMLQRDLAGRGLRILTNAQTEALTGDGRVEALRLADGRELPADLVVFAIGVRPDIELARRAGLDVNRGVIVDDRMRTSDADILAVGECVEHHGRIFGLVAPLWGQARACAANLARALPKAYAPPPDFTSLKITGVELFQAGALGAADDGEDEITLLDAASGVYRKLVLRDERLVGAVLYGDAADGPWFVELIEAGTPVGAFRDQLMFGRDAAAAVAA